MDPIVLIIGIYFFIVVFIIYVLIFGNKKLNKKGCVGGTYRCLTIYVPDFFQTLLQELLPKRYKNLKHEDCLGTEGPFKYSILLFFIFIYSYFVSIYFKFCYIDIKYIYKDPMQHIKILFAVLPFPWIFTAILHFANPGVITKENVDAYLELYPYDYVLYSPKECTTLKIPVVPRSRFDRYTNRRIAKYDHYCPWVLAPIGERTQRYFVAFLISTSITAIVYTVSYFNYLRYNFNELVKIGFVKLTNSYYMNFATAVRTMILHYKMVTSTGIALFLIFLMLLFFTIQQCYYISHNIMQIELDKIEIEERRRIKQHNIDPVLNIYDKGFFGNWFECLFPPTPKV